MRLKMIGRVVLTGLLISSFLVVFAGCGIAKREDTPVVIEDTTKETETEQTTEEIETETETERDTTGYFSYTKGGITFRIPHLFGELEGNTGSANQDAQSTNFYAETGDQLSMLNFLVFDTSAEEISEEDFENDHSVILMNQFMSFEESESMTDVVMGKGDYFELDCGLYAANCEGGFTMDEIPIDVIVTAINYPETKTLLLIFLYQSEYSEKDYTEIYTEMIQEAELAD